MSHAQDSTQHLLDVRCGYVMVMAVLFSSIFGAVVLYLHGFNITIVWWIADDLWCATLCFQAV